MQRTIKKMLRLTPRISSAVCAPTLPKITMAASRSFTVKPDDQEKHIEFAKQAEGDFSENFSALKAESPQDRASIVKNLSLELLNADTPIKVLNLYETNYLTGASERGTEIFIEELFMLLYFFKSHIRDLSFEASERLIRNDYRVNALIQMIFDRYSPGIDFVYQLSTIFSLTTLHSMHGLELTDDQKEMLVSCLLEASQPEKLDSGSPPDMSDVPSLILCMSILETETNGAKIIECVEGLSMAYLALQGTRIDVLGASTLMAGFGYTNMRNVDVLNFLANIVMDKIKSDSFFEDSQTTELIQLVNSMQKLGYVHQDLLNAVYINIIANFKDVKMNWAVILLKTLASTRGIDQAFLLDLFVQMADPLHKLLKNAYEVKTKEANVMGSRQNRQQDVPDCTEYCDLWLSVQLLAALRQGVPDAVSGDASATALKMIANDLVKVFYGNHRWAATEINLQESGVICSGLAIAKVQNEKFIADLGDIVRHKIQDATGVDLIMLTKGAQYMRQFPNTQDLYAIIHAQAVSKYNLMQLSPQEIAVLSNLYTEHKIMTDSPFVTSRATR